MSRHVLRHCLSTPDAICPSNSITTHFMTFIQRNVFIFQCNHFQNFEPPYLCCQGVQRYLAIQYLLAIFLYILSEQETKCSGNKPKGNTQRKQPPVANDTVFFFFLKDVKISCCQSLKVSSLHTDYVICTIFVKISKRSYLL